MTLSPAIQSTMQRHQNEIVAALRRTIMRASETAIHSGAAGSVDTTSLQSYYGQMQYHLGWVDADFSPLVGNSGKLLRPTLLLLAYEAAGAAGMSSGSHFLRPALPAAVAIELTHNFTLIHDDIEDRDAQRHHRTTLWKQWGIPQAINTGDGMFMLARLALWDVVDEGVDPAIAVRLGAALDRACLVLSEGQHLDMSFESRLDISVSQYIDMIGRKTAALMGCAAEMGALLGTRDEAIIHRLSSFGHAMGVAFQVRDDLLGVWASTAESGKTVAGDIYRRKKSLPVLHALEQAAIHDRQFLRTVYMQESPVTGKQLEEILAIFERTQTKTYCRAFLSEQCHLAHEALITVPRHDSPVAARALNDMQQLILFVQETMQI